MVTNWVPVNFTSRQGTSLLAYALLFVLMSVTGCALTEDGAEEPLSSWRPGPSKEAIIEFVQAAVDPAGSGYITPADRIAVFDLDGTLWAETPVVQLAFTHWRLRRMATAQLPWTKEAPFQGMLKEGLGEEHYSWTDILQALKLTHAQISKSEFEAEVQSFFASESHPELGSSYLLSCYQPMRELLNYLASQGFRVFLVSGGGVNFMRAFAGKVYGIPDDRVIGSYGQNSLKTVDGQMEVFRESAFDVFLERQQKVLAIEQHIGKRPTIAVGNVGSGSDVEMLQYSQGRAGPSLQLMVMHDDAQREFAYGEDDARSLQAVHASGWHLISMKRDWLRVFPARETEMQLIGSETSF